LSYTVVGTVFRNLSRFEKQVLYLELVERPAFDARSARLERFHMWLEKQVAAGLSLGEIAQAIDMPERDPSRPAACWHMLDEHVTWLIEHRYARGVRVVYVQ